MKPKMANFMSIFDIIFVPSFIVFLTWFDTYPDDWQKKTRIKPGLDTGLGWQGGCTATELGVKGYRIGVLTNREWDLMGHYSL